MTTNPLDPNQQLTTLTGTLHELTVALTAKTSPKVFAVNDEAARQSIQRAVGMCAHQISTLLTPTLTSTP